MFTEVVPGLSFCLLLAEFLRDAEHGRRPYGTPDKSLFSLTPR